jgi:hypothetical protein
VEWPALASLGSLSSEPGSSPAPVQSGTAEALRPNIVAQFPPLEPVFFRGGISGRPAILPAVFYRDTCLEMGLLVIPMLLTIAVVGSMIHTRLHNRTRGNLPILAIFHGLFDFFSVGRTASLGRAWS